MRRNLLIATLITLVFGAACADSRDGFPVTVKDGLGREVTISRPPQKIVSTIPSNTEILYDLGLKDKVIAVTSHCGKTCDTQGKAVIGGWSDPEIVKEIENLKPDLVIAFGGLQSPIAKEMDKRKMPTFVFFPKTVDETLEQILLVGKITGRSQEASELIKKCRQNLANIERKFEDIPPEKRLKCLRLMSTEAMVIGGKSFQNDIIKKAGGINIFEDIQDDYPIVTLEKVAQKDPDMIIFNRDDEKKAIEWFLKQKGWRDLRAAKEGRMMSISCDHICHANTRIDKTTEMLAKRFYPDRFAPCRIVSLNPSATEVIHALGENDKLIGVTQFCPFPDMLKKKANIGTVLEPDIERIVALSPDIVFATIEGNRKSSVDALRNAGLKVYVLGEIRSFNDIYERISAMGEMLGSSGSAKTVILDMKKRIENIESKVRGEKKLKVFMQLGINPIVTANKNTIINEMIDIAGGINIAEDTLLRYPKYSRESVIMKNPDAIIIVSMGKFEKTALKEWAKYKTINAVRNEKVFVVDSNLVCHMGPRILDGVEKIAELLHPDDF